MATRRPNGDGTAAKLKGNRWHKRITLGGRPVDCYGHTQRECLEDERRRRSEYETTGQTVSPRTTYGAWLTGYWLPEVIEMSGNVPSSVKRTRQTVNLYLVPCLGDRPIAKLTSVECQRFINEVARCGHLGKPLGRATVRRILVDLRQSLNRAVDDGKIGRNPAARLTLPEIKRQAGGGGHTLKPAEIGILLNAIEGHPDEGLYWLLLCTGLRKSELLGLTWGNLDLEACTVTLCQGLQHGLNGYTHALYDLKSESSRAVIPLAKAAVPYLKNHRIRQLEARLAAGDKWSDRADLMHWVEGTRYRPTTAAERDLVFTTVLGMPRHGGALTHQFQRLLKDAGIPPRTVKDLRHSCATMLIYLGYGLEYVKRVLRHSSIAVTSNSYVHLVDEMLAEPVDKLGDAMAALKSAAKANQGQDLGQAPVAAAQ